MLRKDALEVEHQNGVVFLQIKRAVIDKEQRVCAFQRLGDQGKVAEVFRAREPVGLLHPKTMDTPVLNPLQNVAEHRSVEDGRSGAGLRKEAKGCPSVLLAKRLKAGPLSVHRVIRFLLFGTDPAVADYALSWSRHSSVSRNSRSDVTIPPGGVCCHCFSRSRMRGNGRISLDSSTLSRTAHSRSMASASSRSEERRVG